MHARTPKAAPLVRSHQPSDARQRVAGQPLRGLRLGTPSRPFPGRGLVVLVLQRSRGSQPAPAAGPARGGAALCRALSLT